ncbi:uncharacterized protein LOC126988656 [Eriocheir sinensis]|uniref:uncharacterized protein LOC126988656 n=1 Tax=Eriocheir sinensis TaxID=95602 RepID=UPI0021CA2C4C|nr:uncharacterized protein LOC126988656 [Eriocheir sinensis]
MMAGGVSFALLASLGLVIAISHASANTCTLSEHVVKEGEAQTVYESDVRESSKSLSFYVLPGRDFRGVSLKVKKNRTDFLVVYFPLDGCLLDYTNWLNLNVTVFVEEVGGSPNVLHFHVDSSDCQQACTAAYGKKKVKGLRVVAHGSSVWVCDKPPDECLVKESSTSRELPSTSDPDQCKSPPVHLTNSTMASFLHPPLPATIPPNVTAPFCPSPQEVTANYSALSPSPVPPSGLPMGILAAVIAGVVLVVLVVLVVVSAVVCYRRRRRSATQSQNSVAARTQRESMYY